MKPIADEPDKKAPEAPAAAPKKNKRVPQKATPAPKGKKLKRFIDDEGKKYFKYV